MATLNNYEVLSSFLLFCVQSFTWHLVETIIRIPTQQNEQTFIFENFLRNDIHPSVIAAVVWIRRKIE